MGQCYTIHVSLTHNLYTATGIRLVIIKNVKIYNVILRWEDISIGNMKYKWGKTSMFKILCKKIVASSKFFYESFFDPDLIVCLQQHSNYFFYQGRIWMQRSLGSDSWWKLKINNKQMINFIIGEPRELSDSTYLNQYYSLNVNNEAVSRYG